MSTTLTNGLKLPDKGSVDWYADMQNNYTILDGAVGTVAEHTSQIAGKAPAVHTHGKADITDLLNSNFIPSANNSYDLGSSSYQWNNAYIKSLTINGVACGDILTYNASEFVNVTGAQTIGGVKTFTSSIGISKGSGDVELAIKNTSLSLKANTNSGMDDIRFMDKDNLIVGGLRQSFTNSKVTGIVYSRSYSSDGNSSTQVEFNLITDHQNGIGDACVKCNNFYPNQNATINLGTSTNKWKSVYSDSYYYGTTAWGLDKDNTWTGANIFYKSIQIHGARNAYIMPEFSASYSGLSFGTVEFKQSFKFGDWVDNNSTIGLNTSNAYVEIYAGLDSSDNINKVRLHPSPNATTAELGTSTAKWKTLNGVNPGALSLPNFSAEFDVSGQIVPPTGENQISINWGRNTFTPSVNGWLSVRIHKATSIEIYRSIRSSYCVASRVESADDICVCSPVVAGVEYTIKIQATQFSSDYDHFRLSPCLGNV